jgi:hypothetical protein
MGPAGEAADVGDVTDQPGGTGRADPVERLQAATGGLDELGQFRVRRCRCLAEWRPGSLESDRPPQPKRVGGDDRFRASQWDSGVGPARLSGVHPQGAIR